MNRRQIERHAAVRAILAERAALRAQVADLETELQVAYQMLRDAGPGSPTVRMAAGAASTRLLPQAGQVYDAAANRRGAQ